MGILIKKATPVIQAPIALPKRVLILGRSKVPSAEPPKPSVQLAAPPPVPRKPSGITFKKQAGLPFTHKPVPVEDLTSRQQDKLITAGLMNESDKVWETVKVGDRVRITNGLFPWVKHYAPGDICTVAQIPSNISIYSENPVRDKVYLLSVTEPLQASRKGQRCAMFRWEFDKLSES
jgi:hypothetical protein